MHDLFTIWIFPLLIGTLGYATPIALAALGGLFSERAGVINIALEGLMIIGCFFAVLGADKGGSWIVGLIAAMVAGGVLALLHAFASINLHADQIISGTAIILLAQGLADYLNLTIYGTVGAPNDISRVPQVHLGKVGDLGFTVLIMIALVFVTRFVIYQTRFGLHLRSVGEHPRAADTVGIDVYKMRYIAVIMSGVLAGLAGAYLSIDFGGTYTTGMTGGTGFIALAALIFGKWNPIGALGASALFGFTSKMADILQNKYGITPELVTAIPYIITIVALAGFVGKSIGPAAAGKPYSKG